MESKRCFASIAIALLVGVVFISNSSAGLVTSDTAYLIGNFTEDNAPDDYKDKPGCFKVHVDYAVYDGNDEADPLGDNGLYQAVFKLTHLGSDGSGETVVKVGMFTVYSGDYTSAVAVDQGGSPTPVLPNYIASKYTPEALTDRAVYYFDDDAPNYDSTFAVDDVSQLLVLTFDPTKMPQENIGIEIDSSVYGIYGEGTVTLIPEPVTLLLLGSGGVLLRVRKRRSA